MKRVQVWHYLSFLHQRKNIQGKAITCKVFFKSAKTWYKSISSFTPPIIRIWSVLRVWWSHSTCSENMIFLDRGKRKRDIAFKQAEATLPVLYIPKVLAVPTGRLDWSLLRKQIPPTLPCPCILCQVGPQPLASTTTVSTTGGHGLAHRCCWTGCEHQACPDLGKVCWGLSQPGSSSAANTWSHSLTPHSLSHSLTHQGEST